MSYAFAIVLPPISETDSDAWKELDDLIAESGSPPEAFRVLHDKLVAVHPCICSLPDEEVDDGVWSDGPIWNNFAKRAAVLGLVFSRVDEVLPFVVETATALGMSVFDWQTAHIHRPDGIRGINLTVEDQPLFPSPTLAQIQATVDALTPNGGPGFLIVEGPGPDYAQAAGGEGQFTAEWREYTGATFRHWVGGRPGMNAAKETAIPTNGFVVTVNENERLTGDEVKAILTAFALGNGRSSSFTWRDVTERFE